MKATAVSRTIFVCVAYLSVACSVLESFLTHWSYMLSSDLELALTFSTPRPYVYRVLSPLIVKGVAALVPARLGAALLDNWGRGVVALSVVRYGYAGKPSIEFLVSLWLMLGSLWGAMLIWRARVGGAFPGG